MPNVTSVWDFSPGETLTAAKLDDVNCGIHVFSGTATRDAAYGGSGERTLAEGEFAYLSDSNTTQYYDGSSWQNLGTGALTLVKSQTIGSGVSSVEVTGAFSATYDNYRIIVSGGTSTQASTLKLQMGATTTGYYEFYITGAFNSSTVTGANGDNVASFTAPFQYGTDMISGVCDLYNPFASKNTVCTATAVRSATSGTGLSVFYGGYLANTTSYTAFTLIAGFGTLTGGTIRVYGYSNS